MQAALVTLFTATAVVFAERGTDVPKDKADVLWQLGFGIFSTVPISPDPGPACRAKTTILK